MTPNREISEFPSFTVFTNASQVNDFGLALYSGSLAESEVFRQPGQRWLVQISEIITGQLVKRITTSLLSGERRKAKFPSYSQIT